MPPRRDDYRVRPELGLPPIQVGDPFGLRDPNARLSTEIPQTHAEGSMGVHGLKSCLELRAENVTCSSPSGLDVGLQPSGLAATPSTHPITTRLASQSRRGASLYFIYYNLARIHQTLRVTPAMEAGVVNHEWSLEVELMG